MIEFPAKIRQRWEGLVVWGGASRHLVIEGLGIQVIGIDKTGEDHAAEKGHLKEVAFQARFQGGRTQHFTRRKLYFSLPLIQEWRQALSREAIFQSSALDTLPAVGQSGVVARNGIGQQEAEAAVVLDRQHRASGGMVDPNGIARDPSLEFVGVLAQIVQQSGKSGQVAGGESRGSVLCQRCNCVKMLGKWLPVGLVRPGCRMCVKGANRFPVHIDSMAANVCDGVLLPLHVRTLRPSNGMPSKPPAPFGQMDRVTLLSSPPHTLAAYSRVLR